MVRVGLRTIAMDVTDYQKAHVNVWRGVLNGGGSYAISFEESTDQNAWSDCTGGTAADPGQSRGADITAREILTVGAEKVDVQR